MGRAMATLAGVLVLALLAAGLSEATLAVGHRGGISDDTAERSTVVVTPSATPRIVASPSALPSSTPAATPSPTPSSSLSAGPVATTNSFVHMRSAESTSSAILFNLNGGTQVQLLSGGDTEWQEVEYQGADGFVFKTYLNY